MLAVEVDHKNVYVIQIWTTPKTFLKLRQERYLEMYCQFERKGTIQRLILASILVHGNFHGVFLLENGIYKTSKSAIISFECSRNPEINV